RVKRPSGSANGSPREPSPPQPGSATSACRSSGSTGSSKSWDEWDTIEPLPIESVALGSVDARLCEGTQWSISTSMWLCPWLWRRFLLSNRFLELGYCSSARQRCCCWACHFQRPSQRYCLVPWPSTFSNYETGCRLIGRTYGGCSA